MANFFNHQKKYFSLITTFTIKNGRQKWILMIMKVLKKCENQVCQVEKLLNFYQVMGKKLIRNFTTCFVFVLNPSIFKNVSFRILI